jgi:uncharacterized protein (TIGR03437 family)
MNTRVRKIAFAVLSTAPLALWGFGSGPVIRRTGAPVDENGATCTACHRGNDLNSPGGFVRIEAVPYRSGQRQLIRVTVSHPEAQRWGFQLTARLASDETKKAGTFTAEQGSPIKVRCAPDGRDATPSQSCGSDVEFAEHGGTAESTFGGANGAKTFEVEWTAPEGADLGDVIFYAAGNAANSNNQPTGDRIYNTSLRIEAESTCNYIVRPRVQGIGNAATSQGAISMNTLIAIYGANFVPSGVRRSVGAGDIRESRIPTELGCVAVEIGGRRVPVIHIQQDQINAQIPTITQTGSVPLKVIINPGRPSEVSVEGGMINLQNYSPAFFTFNGSSIAALIAGTSTPAANTSLFSNGRPAAPGEVVELYATGLGPSEPVFQSGEIVPGRQVPLRERITLTIGGTTLAASDIRYVGLAPGSISGLYQINAAIPTAAADGDLPVLLTVGGVSSPAGTTIPVRRR